MMDCISLRLYSLIQKAITSDFPLQRDGVRESERENCTEMILWISYIWRLWWKAREKMEIKLLHMCSCVYKCSVFGCVCVCVCVCLCVCARVCVASLAVFLSVETLFSGEMDDASFWHLYKTTHTHKHTHTHTHTHTCHSLCLICSVIGQMLWNILR